MRPAQQGSFDGLCGVYALVNALEPAGITGRRGKLHQDFFIQLSHGLGAAALLSAMGGGLDVEDLMRAGQVGLRWLHDVHGYELKISQPLEHTEFRSFAAYLDVLGKIVGAPETAAIISFKRPGMRHWSVVTAVEADILYLRDSGGLYELPLDGFGLQTGSRCLNSYNTLVVAPG